ncbi:WPP domain-interacting tail-anchored protein 2 [Andrographis paniculata]|uniref:WPP domain-interacting tail-anchored protein 2 n=1 Tax=Andrographis paniculata TaxID=175694 RepID=UPI0021E9732B|nr:WPP domain-interacting tail-anchored protein 2 [Andrographis paniculata]XP_051146309.1 WPP domain-interacting tail-anchored protein 2 [Andrographis paniculata]XP_051146310.1 WPP domain-interacting tail-anchored protein 2 [Andrographis paniculata]
MSGNVTNGIGDRKFSFDGFSYSCDDDEEEELQSVLKALFEVDMIIDYSSEKLANLENLLHVLSGENNVESIDFENDASSEEFVEKAFAFDLMYAVLIFEVREIEDRLVDLLGLIGDAHRKIFASERSTELVAAFGGKIRSCEDVLKESRDRILGMTIRLAKLEMTSIIVKHSEYKRNLDTGLNRQISTPEQARVRRMLELSLANEVELEKTVTRHRQNEEDLKVKIRLIEQVGVAMEEAAEVAWGRFLEADNAAAVLMGISRETLGRLRTLEFERINSAKRERELTLKLNDCVNRLNEKEVSIQNLDGKVAELISDNAEVTGLRNQVETLERKLVETRSSLAEATISSERKVKETEEEIRTLKREIFDAKNRAAIAEERVAHLTESNVELTDELDFLKGSNETNAKKVSVLEKQVREFDIQLQHSRASSEAGQEQQNMLYTAIWDMETLIDELKQKVASAETKAEISDERCVLLSESNDKLNKELEFLRSKMAFVGASLDEATTRKQSSADEIAVRTRVITNMVVQLAIERERIQKQLSSLAKENMVLRENLRKDRRIGEFDEKTFVLSGLDGKVAEAVSKNFEVEDSDEAKMTSSNSENNGMNSTMNPEDEGVVGIGKSRRRMRAFVVLMVLVSIFMAHLFHRRM